MAIGLQAPVRFLRVNDETTSYTLQLYTLAGSVTVNLKLLAVLCVVSFSIQVVGFSCPAFLSVLGVLKNIQFRADNIMYLVSSCTRTTVAQVFFSTDN